MILMSEALLLISLFFFIDAIVNFSSSSRNWKVLFSVISAAIAAWMWGEK